MRTPPKRPRAALGVETLEARELPSVAPTSAVLSQQGFDQTAAGALPSGWSQAGSPSPFTTVSANGTGGSHGLAVSGDSTQVARAWAPGTQPADVRASADVLASSLVPAQVLVRGSNLGTSAPTYYAVSVTRGLNVQLLSVVSGTTKTLGHVQSASFLSNVWVTVSLQASGTSLQAFVRRQDNGQYLNAQGKWQSGAAAAVTATDSAIRGGGQVGLARASGVTGDVSFDNFTVTPANGSTALVSQNFNGTAPTQLPAGWSQWGAENVFGAASGRSVSGSKGLAVTSTSGASTLAWGTASAPADAQVSADVYLNSLAPADVFLRGSSLGTASPTYYAVAVTRGVDVRLLRVSRGTATSLGEVLSDGYLSNQWVRVTLRASGTSLQAQVQRLDTHQYLTVDGGWQTSPASALTVTDSRITGAGLAGVGKVGGPAGTITFDDVTVARPAGAPLAVTLQGLGSGAVVSRTTTVQAQVSNAQKVLRVEFYVDGQLQGQDASAPYSWSLDPSLLSVGSHTLAAVAYDTGGATARTAITLNVTAAAAPGLPQHYPWIRIAELAYGGTPIGSFEQNLLKNSVDLVIPNTSLLPAIDAASPKTTQLIYTNVSSLYQGLLTDWLDWADAHHVSREAAFYHVTAPTSFSGNSGSAMQVSWFWAVYEGGGQPNFSDLTNAAHVSGGRSVPFGGYGTSLYLAYPDRFREINFSLAAGARGGWQGVLEYPTAVDALGNPTAWAPLKTLTDTTAGLSRSGQVTFDPPANWVTASLNGSDRMYYVRVRTTRDGTAPVANTILGRDYTNSHGGWSGTVPVFDYAADTNHDGYLNNAEYAVAVAHGDTARFAYEGRLFGIYGPMRPWTDPSNTGFRQWAADYSVRLLKGQPMADGLFVDNSSGKPTTGNAPVQERVTTYASDYGALLHAIGRAIAPRWILANTSGGGTVSDGVIGQNSGYFEEFALRPLSANWAQFEDLATLVQHRADLETPPPYAVLDSLPAGGSPTDPRTQIATLAEYYLLADPKRTFLDFYGGYEPATTWARHWSPAVTFNVGQPVSGWSLWATGRDPGDSSLTYRVYQRWYSNALVVYRPLSHAQGVTRNGSTAASSTAVFGLGRPFRPLRADGTLGSPTTAITLRNGEGAILVPVT